MINVRFLMINFRLFMIDLRFPLYRDRLVVTPFVDRPSCLCTDVPASNNP